MVDKFVMDIMDYSESVSGYTSPANIIMFGVSQVFLEWPISCFQSTKCMKFVCWPRFTPFGLLTSVMDDVLGSTY